MVARMLLQCSSMWLIRIPLTTCSALIAGDPASTVLDPERRRRVGQELALVLNGRWPRSCVNPSVLARTGLLRWQPYSMERGPGA
jgi:hypothetical protein